MTVIEMAGEKTFISQENGLISEKDLEDPPSGGVKKREMWAHKLDFLVACLGGSVGLANVWRFPYLCYKNGGGAFFIPYFVCMILGSLPLFILEVSVGQYMSSGGMGAWRMVPLFQGLGMTCPLIIFACSCYYNVVLAWTFMYIFHSFAAQLPWDRCDGWWNTANCSTNFSAASSNMSNVTSGSVVDPVVEFWENKVLGVSDGIDNPGTVKWDLALCLLLAWALVYLCICKGIRATGKIMYVTALSPYVLMVIILIRNATLPSASLGVSYYLKPNLTKLADPYVWIDAGRQTFFSSSIACSVILTLGSYNKFRHNSLRDSVAFSFINAFTSFFAGFLVFTVLGFMAFQQSKPINEVAESGPGLVFIAYPKAISQMPLSQFWSVLFFLMILLLGLDSQFVSVEAVVTAVIDEFPHVLRRGHRKEVFIGVLCIGMFLIGQVFITNGGVYVFQLIDFYCGGQILIVIGILEPVVIVYFYGIRRFRDNIRMMVGDSWSRWMFPYLTTCWTVVTPVLCFIISLIGIINYEALSYSRPNKSVYNYPTWTVGLGWLLTACIVVWIPGMAVYLFVKHGFTKEVWRKSLVPYHLNPHQMRPEDENEKRLSDLQKGEKAEEDDCML